MKTDNLLEIMVQLLIFLITVLIIILVLAKISYIWDQQETMCEESGGVIVNYECFESFLSAFRCDKIETGEFCIFANGTKYKIPRE